jgi:hypothetical protein
VSDPLGDLGAIGAVQRQAIEHATRVIGQFLDMVDGARDRMAASPGGPDAGEASGARAGARDPEAGFREIRADAARAVDLYVELFRRTFDAYVDLAEATLRRRDRPHLAAEGPVGADVGGDAADGPAVAPLVLRASPGGVAEATVWLHNTSDAAIGAQPVRATALTAHDGAVIDACRVVVEPATLSGLAAHASGRAVVRVHLDGAPAGRYVGHLLTSGASLVVQLHVED